MNVIFNKSKIKFTKEVFETIVYETATIVGAEYTFDGTYIPSDKVYTSGATPSAKTPIFYFTLNDYVPGREYIIRMKYSSVNAASESVDSVIKCRLITKVGGDNKMVTKNVSRNGDTTEVVFKSDITPDEGKAVQLFFYPANDETIAIGESLTFHFEDFAMYHKETEED